VQSLRRDYNRAIDGEQPIVNPYKSMYSMGFEGKKEEEKEDRFYTPQKHSSLIAKPEAR